MKKISFIAAFPPPVSGQSLAAELLFGGLKDAGAALNALDSSESIGGDPVWVRVGKLASVELRLLFQCLTTPDLLVYLQLGHGRQALVRDLVFMLTAAVTRRSCVAHVHGSGFRAALEALPRPLRWAECKVLGRLHAAVVLSDSLRAMFEGIVPQERVYSVDNGIDEAFARHWETRQSHAAEHPLHVLFLSNFLKAKGVCTVLEAARIAQEAHKDWEFHLVGARVTGQGVDVDAFVERHQLANVRLSDTVQGAQKIACYLDADVFVLPSEYEGQPLCILEALFASLPVVTTRVGGIPEIFGASPCVRYVEPHEPRQLFDALCELEEPGVRRDMAQHAFGLAVSRFTAKAHVEKMLAIFQEA